MSITSLSTERAGGHDAVRHRAGADADSAGAAAGVQLALRDPIPATIYYVQVSWVSASGQEGEPSDLTTYETPDASSLAVVRR